MKPTLVIETYKKSLIKAAADKQAANEAISTANAALSALVKPANYDRAPVVRKLLNITRTVSISKTETAALAAIGVQCEGKLDKTVRDNLAIVAKPFLELCDKYDSEAAKIAELIGELNRKLKSLENDEKRAVSVRDNALGTFFRTTAQGIANAFGVENAFGEEIAFGRYVAEMVAFVSNLKATKDDLEKLGEVENCLLELSICDSSINPSCSKSYLLGLELPYLAEFIGVLGNVVRAPVEAPDVSAGYNDGTPKPPVLAAKKKWQEFAREYSGTLVNRDELSNKAFSRLMALGKRVAMHAQKGTLSSIRAAEKSGIVSGRLDSAVMLSITNMHKILQGGINAGVRLAVETSGKDLSILNRVTQSPLIWGEKTGFNLSDFRAYVEDCLPHLEFKKGAWQMRSKKALENRKLGAFGVYIFGQLPARLITDKPPLFPLLDWLQFRELKKQFSREAAAANKAAKAAFENAWLEFEESFPLEQQLATVEATLAALDTERAAIVEKAAKLKAAMQ